jgi:polysaccharide deacetylase 2 family uncharacterized protein YibQ
MLQFATRPVGYLVVGGLAMVLGLSTGIGIGYFAGGNGPRVVEVTEAKRQDNVVSLKQVETQLKALPIPIPVPLPLETDTPEVNAWIEDPSDTEDESAAAQAPAPWPELTKKVVREKRRQEVAEHLDILNNLEPDETALASYEDIWATPLKSETLLESESPGERIDREATAWEANSVTVSDPAGKPMISIVIDDLGLNRRNTVRTIRLPGPLTLAFLTYAEDLEKQTSSAHAAGHELMVHFPMEPKNPKTDTGPNALRRGMTAKEIRRRFNWGMDRFKGYVGINNHMGSAFTGDAAGMAVVMEEIRKRDILFLDSMTTQRSAGRKTAASAGVPFVARDVFLDNEIDARHIDKRLAEVEEVARRQGHAIAIGHPHGATIEALARWLPGLEKAGFVIVPVSMIVKHRRGA